MKRKNSKQIVVARSVFRDEAILKRDRDYFVESARHDEAGR